MIYDHRKKKEGRFFPSMLGWGDGVGGMGGVVGGGGVSAKARAYFFICYLQVSELFLRASYLQQMFRTHTPG